MIKFQNKFLVKTGDLGGVSAGWPRNQVCPLIFDEMLGGSLWRYIHMELHSITF